jgi:enoyl-[acyl-carrier protein] reductase III
VRSLRRSGAGAVAVRADVSHSGDLDRLLGQCAETFGYVQIFVSNAALTAFREVGELTDRQVLRTFETSALPLLTISARLFPQFAAAGYGRIVAVSSAGSRRAVRGYAGLGMAKGAVETLTRYLAEYGGRELENVTANAVVPHAFDNGDPAHTPYQPLASQIAEESARTPGGRAPTMAEIALTVLFLSSQLAAAVNGQTIAVDRGWSIA